MRCDDEPKQEGRKAGRQRRQHGFCPLCVTDKSKRQKTEEPNNMAMALELILYLGNSSMTKPPLLVTSISLLGSFIHDGIMYHTMVPIKSVVHDNFFGGFFTE